MATIFSRKFTNKRMFDLKKRCLKISQLIDKSLLVTGWTSPETCSVTLFSLNFCTRISWTQVNGENLILLSLWWFSNYTTIGNIHLFFFFLYLNNYATWLITQLPSQAFAVRQGPSPHHLKYFWLIAWQVSTGKVHFLVWLLKFTRLPNFQIISALFSPGKYFLSLMNKRNSRCQFFFFLFVTPRAGFQLASVLSSARLSIKGNRA